MNTAFFINKYRNSKKIFGEDHMIVNENLVDEYVF